MQRRSIRNIQILGMMLLSSLYSFDEALAREVSADEASAIAQAFLSKDFSEQNHRALKVFSARRTSQQSPVEPYYIFTGEDGAGFVIVSGDDIANPILGYSDNASIDVDGELPTGMQELLADIENQMLQARQSGAIQTEVVAKRWSSLAKGNVVKELKTATWNQGSPYNSQCPRDGYLRSVTGCVPTAYAILMRYFRYPSAGLGSTQAYYTSSKNIYVASRNLSHIYDWDNMPMQLEGSGYTSQQADNVATLLADIGAAFQVDYGADETGGYMGLPQLFTHFDYFPGTSESKEDFTAEEWNAKLKAQIDLSHPVIYRGANEEESGHIFIIDGYTDDDYFHVNWGWGGSYNGYFALDVLCPGERNYNSGQAADFNCVPMSLYDGPMVAKLGEREYPSLQTAIYDGTREGKQAQVVMTNNLRLNGYVIQKDQDVKIDLNGKQIELANSIKIQGHLSVGDSGENGTLTHVSGNHGLFSNYGSLEITGGTFVNESDDNSENSYKRCIWSDDESQTIISGGTFRCKGNQTLCLRGNTTISDGHFSNSGNSCVLSYHSTTGTLTIEGGTFESLDVSIEGNTDNRRCILTKDSSNIVIRGGTFICNTNQTLCLYGNATINGGNFINNGNGIVIANYNTAGELVIRDGQFSQTATTYEGTGSYRRCLYTIKGSKTYIYGGVFESASNNLLLYGELTINDGIFVSTGNAALISYNNTQGTLNINGGSFSNTATSYDGTTDYRRTIWTNSNTQANISGGSFGSNSRQTLCFNGDASIKNASIENTNEFGCGCLAFSGAQVCLDDVKIRSPFRVFYSDASSSIVCVSGLFSNSVSDSFLAEGSQCIDNTDNETRWDYPYKVVSTVDINGVQEEISEGVSIFYDLNGRRHQTPQRGIQIVRDRNGKIHKKICK